MVSHKRAKVLMVGPVSGRLRLLSDKIRSLQESKAGPFDVCLCAGPFFYQTTKASVAASAAVFEKEAEAGTGKIKVGGAGEKASEEGSSQNMEHQAAAIKDGNDLVDGSLLFDVPVLFVDVGDGLPAGIKVDDNSFVDAMNNDENEVDLDEEDEMEQGDDEINLDDAEEDMEDGSSKKNDDNEGEGIPPRTRKGLRRIAQNLYQLVGDSPQQGLLDSVADIVNVSLPLIDSQSTTSDYDADSKCREAGTSLTIGFLGPKIRMPCKGFEEKSRSTSFLGCDVLLSGEWGRGISSATCGAFSANDQIAIMASGRSTATGGVGGESLEAGSYYVANLVALSRPRYHVAPGPTVPIHLGLDTTPRHRFVSSRPYRYPVTSSGPSEGGSHAGRFLAMGSILPPSEYKTLGKAFKFIHAVQIVPLSDMDAHDRESAKEMNSAVDFPYTSVPNELDKGGAPENFKNMMQTSLYRANTENTKVNDAEAQPPVITNNFLQKNQNQVSPNASVFQQIAGIGTKLELFESVIETLAAKIDSRAEDQTVIGLYRDHSQLQSAQIKLLQDENNRLKHQLGYSSDRSTHSTAPASMVLAESSGPSSTCNNSDRISSAVEVPASKNFEGTLNGTKKPSRVSGIAGLTIQSEFIRWRECDAFKKMKEASPGNQLQKRALFDRQKRRLFLGMHPAFTQCGMGKAFENAMILVAMSIKDEQWNAIVAGNLDTTSYRGMVAMVEEQTMIMAHELESEVGISKTRIMKRLSTVHNIGRRFHAVCQAWRNMGKTDTEIQAVITERTGGYWRTDVEL